MSQQRKGWTHIATGRGTAWVVALVPLMLGILAIGLWGQGERDRLAIDQLPEGYDSTLAVDLAEALPETDGSTAIVLFTAEEGDLSEAQIGALQGLTAQISQIPVLTQSDDGTAALAVVAIEAASSSENADAVAELRELLAEQVPDGVVAQVTGPAGIEADLAGVFEGANFRLLGVTALVVALLLIITYRSPVLWIIPLTVVGIADQAAAVFATRVLAAFDVAWNESTIGILSVLVFGAGTNYALLLISRYRDELKLVEDRREAMRTALRRTTEPVVAASGTVLVGLLTLILSLVPTTRGLGIAGAVGILTAAIFVLGVLPSALVIFPRSIFWPKKPVVGEVMAAETKSVWRRIGDVVAKRPTVVMISVLAGLAVLASGIASTKLGLDTAEQFLSTPESITAADRIGESFPGGTSNPTTVVTTQDATQVADAVAGVEGVASVTPGASGSGVTQLQVVLTASEGTPEAEDAIVAIREAVSGFDETHVGGPVAETMDGTAAADRDRLLIIPIILAFVVVALMGLLRSVLAPIILVATVVATYAAAMGAAWWIVTGVLGYSALDESMPLNAFLFLVALGVDYNIFLVTRAREEAKKHGTREGMLRALGATGGVITSAGVLLAAVFAVLGVLPLVVLAQLGLVVCIGVLIDTLIVRTMLVPSIALQLGGRFWWPQKVEAAA